MPRTAKRSIYEIIADPKATQLLPSLTAIVKELENLIGKQNVMIEEISRVIRNDQSMAVRILRMANSVYFAPVQPIVDLDQAVLYLGLNQVRSTILTARCIEKSCPHSQDILNWTQFWTHAIAVGYITKILSSSLPDQEMNAESFYAMGLFHDIGKLALAFLSPEDFATVLLEARDKNSPTSPIESELLGLDHANLGAWYLQHQGLPPNLVEPIRLHHAWNMDPKRSGNAILINLSDQLAHFMKFGQSGSHLPEDANPYESEEWKLYHARCFPDGRDPGEHVGFILDKLEKVPDLIRCTLALTA